MKIGIIGATGKVGNKVLTEDKHMVMKSLQLLEMRAN